MKRMIKFPSIEQFRNVVANVNRTYAFVGLDENGDAVYDNTKPKPSLTFKGTVKLHGTNAGVCYTATKGLWVQSRENIITPTKDNAGFAFFVESKEEIFKYLILQLVNNLYLDISENTVSIYGEWCGTGIQRGVGISNIPKSFFIFGVKVTPHTKTEEELKNNPAYWVDSSGLRDIDNNIFNIDDFQTYSIEIDFNMPQLSQNTLAELTLEVEKECPVAKHFGFSGIGEGIVWTCDSGSNRYIFKVKGEKHSSSKVKTLASVDTEKIESIKEFIEYAVSESRFNQALENVFPNGEPKNTNKLGDVIRWVIKDIIKEELDTLTENKLETKEINKYVSNKVREMFFALPL
jgi:hypothetical protein